MITMTKLLYVTSMLFDCYTYSFLAEISVLRYTLPLNVLSITFVVGMVDGDASVKFLNHIPNGFHMSDPRLTNVEPCISFVWTIHSQPGKHYTWRWMYRECHRHDSLLVLSLSKVKNLGRSRSH